MIDLDELRATLRDMNLTKVAEACDLPYGRVYRLVHRTDLSPRFETVRAVVDYLEDRKLTKVA